VAQEEYPNDVEGSPGVACSDTINPRSFQAWQSAADRNERRYGYFGRIWNGTWSACRAWPRTAGQDRHRGPWNARTSSPVLVVGNFCVDSAVTLYLLTGRVPPMGTVCQPEGSPFGPTSAAMLRAAQQTRAGLNAATLPPAVREAFR
jgi:hypothetical protein